MSIIILTSFLVFQSVAQSYGASRLFSLTAIFLSPFLVIGILLVLDILFRILRLEKIRCKFLIISRFCLIIFLIFSFAFNLCIPHQILGIDQQYLSSESDTFHNKNIYESEKLAAIWLNNHYGSNTNVKRPVSGNKELWSAGRFSLSTIKGDRYNDNYFYFGKVDISKGYHLTYFLENKKFDLAKVFTNRDVIIFYENK